MDSPEKTVLIAPCGMNCSICIAYLRAKNTCTGCRGSDKGKPKGRLQCKIKHCEKLNSGFCFTCEDYPCKKLQHIDTRYRTTYNMSMIENLENIKKIGLHNFVLSEKERWRCATCNGTICVHKGYCLVCGAGKK